MTYMKPCRGCPENNACARQDNLRAKIKGVGLSAVTFRCPDLIARFPIGQRVVARIPYAEPTGDWDYPDFEDADSTLR